MDPEKPGTPNSTNDRTPISEGSAGAYQGSRSPAAAGSLVEGTASMVSQPLLGTPNNVQTANNTGIQHGAPRYDQNGFQQQSIRTDSQPLPMQPAASDGHVHTAMNGTTPAGSMVNGIGMPTSPGSINGMVPPMPAQPNMHNEQPTAPVVQEPKPPEVPDITKLDTGKLLVKLADVTNVANASVPTGPPLEDRLQDFGNTIADMLRLNAEILELCQIKGGEGDATGAVDEKKLDAMTTATANLFANVAHISQQMHEMVDELPPCYTRSAPYFRNLEICSGDFTSFSHTQVPQAAISAQLTTSAFEFLNTSSIANFRLFHDITSESLLTYLLSTKLLAKQLKLITTRGSNVKRAFSTGLAFSEVHCLCIKPFLSAAVPIFGVFVGLMVISPISLASRSIVVTGGTPNEVPDNDRPLNGLLSSSLSRADLRADSSRPRPQLILELGIVPSSFESLPRRTAPTAAGGISLVAIYPTGMRFLIAIQSRLNGDCTAVLG
ncbi:stage V sporulation K, putative [Babesia ovis]|uniref:Stage V sporulation K, putative n=1 Tax=Babesia ovis TaxID=5869 RepID=A0A9W5TEL9_BABOV|nr:stage V sporulation K, putative [Babesia ovis]